MNMDFYKVKEAIGNNRKFISPFLEPSSYYIFIDSSEDDKNINDDIIKLYWEKLKYAVQNADLLIRQAFNISFYEYLKSNYEYLSGNIIMPKSPKDMCQRLRFESFVLCPERKEIGSVLSNPDFMSGHFIDCAWDYDWNNIYSYIC